LGIGGLAFSYLKMTQDAGIDEGQGSELFFQFGACLAQGLEFLVAILKASLIGFFADELDLSLMEIMLGSRALQGFFSAACCLFSGFDFLSRLRFLSLKAAQFDLSGLMTGAQAV
jgi:hypothetical protein